eukprot:CAMPEP_0172161660 /NCGR_PEP_ID=MMETSP1050-20130122/6246_1 /TAXON_ID=233186 /ORGANISM="Cryptomonas curvata, Strain CCAP979/52" /LENGTH=185 /DNA_ID=CAMNT_0012831577 /DNA_START=193 /DNA_END=747 /DNA_ORIENTATION=+
MEPLSVIPMQRGLLLLQKERAEMLETTGATISSERCTWEVPSVLVLRRYVHPVRPKGNRTEKMSNANVLRRDGYTCGYCGGAALTVDHIIPRSRGGSKQQVGQCRRVLRAVQLPQERPSPDELGGSIRLTARALGLIRRPVETSVRYFAVMGLQHGPMDPRWAKFLPASSFPEHRERPGRAASSR